ncbi:hypothetical protein QYM41_13190 [Kocuria sp. CPCC 205268]|uniref:hypothetical protein n=1 Tax=Kocuria oxytropis TaxID=3058913 RepID=UPI0034D66F4B
MSRYCTPTAYVLGVLALLAVIVLTTPNGGTHAHRSPADLTGPSSGPGPGVLTRAVAAASGGTVADAPGVRTPAAPGGTVPRALAGLPA